MSRLAAVAAAVLVVGGTGAALATGLGPAPGGDSGDEITEFPTATPTPSGASAAATRSGDAAATATPEPRPAFATTVDSVETCGETCRDVTSTVSNDGTAAATGVTVYTRIVVGGEASGDVVWQGREDVGRLAANDSHTTTRRVELSLAEGAAVERADGWITVQTTIQSDGQTVTVTEPWQVA